MKSSRLAFVSLAANVLLLAVVCWQAQRFGQREDQLAPQTAATAVATEPASSPSPAPAAQRPALAVKSATISSASTRPAFDWRQVESTDYRNYIKNLRATGCPEQTVRDIVAADAAAAFAVRRAEAIAARYHDFKFWQTSSTEEAARAELTRQRRAVDADMGDVLRELLGPDVAPPETTREWKLAELEQQLSFLPPGKRDETRSLLLRNEENDALIKSLADAHRPTEDADELNRILETYDGKRAELARLLSPEEYEQLELTISWTADNLRRAMVHFHPTEAEFREIFDAWRAHDENLARLYATGQPDPGNEHVFAKIKEMLGDVRFNLYRSTWWK